MKEKAARMTVLLPFPVPCREEVRATRAPPDSPRHVVLLCLAHHSDQSSPSECKPAALMLQVLSVGNLHPPKVIYEYVVSLQQNVETYRWQMAENWGKCDRLCQGETMENRNLGIDSILASGGWLMSLPTHTHEFFSHITKNGSASARVQLSKY